MKKLLLTLFCLFAMFTVKAQCDFTLSGTDSWGDGWNGASIDIDVAGVISSFTLSDGSFNSVTIPSYTGDVADFTFNSGAYDAEIGITIFGPDGTTLYDGGAPSDGAVFVSSTSTSTCAPPSCTNPSSLASSNITGTSADIAWTAGGTETSWDIELVDIGGGETATGTPTTSVSTNSYQAIGLESNNNYQVYVRANCGQGEVSDWVDTSFTTSCPIAITSFPSTTSFTLNPPTACWSQAENGDPTTGPSGADASEWNSGRSFNSLPSNRINLWNTGTNDWLISPLYDIPAGVAHELVVTVAVTGYNSSSAGSMGSDDEVQLLQTTDRGENWSTVTTWNAANQPATLGTSFTADLTSLSGNVGFALWATEGTIDDSEDFDFHVGAFTVREIPNCLEPTSIVIADVIATSASVSWSDSNTVTSSGFEYEINEVLISGNVLFNAGTTASADLDIVGLTADSQYEIRVRAICGSSETSAWTSFVSWYQTEVPGCALNPAPIDGSTINSGSTVTFTWDAPTTGGAATAYSFRFGTSIPSMFAISTNATSPYTVTGIPTGATFYYQVVPTNAGGEASSCSIQAVTTEAAPQAPAGVSCNTGDQSTPVLTESFDAQGSWTGDFGSGGGQWQFDTDATTSGGTGPTGPQDTGGSYMFYEASGISGGSASAVSPVIDLSGIAAGNEAELSFYMHAFGGDMGTLRVGASSSPTGPFTNLITWGGSYQTTTAEPWYQIGADVSAYVGGNLYIEFNNTYGGGYAGDVSIDTMEVVVCDLTPTCNFPTDLAVSGVSDSSVELDWTANGTEVIWDIELVDITASGSATGTPTTENINTNPYVLIGLTSQNDYELYLRADCGRGEVSDWVGPVSFTTTCASYTLPFEEDMESAGSTPDCWTTSSSSGRNWSFSTAATFGNTISDHTTGSGYFALVDASTTAVGTDITLESPFVDVSSLSTPALKFYLHHFAVAGSSNSISVDIYNGATWDNVYTDNTGDINSWEEVIIILDPSTIDDEIKVRFVVDTATASNYQNDIGVDDVSFIEAPNCPNPSSLATSNITATSADLAWTANGSEGIWDIELVDITASGSATGTPTTENIDTNPYTLTGLTSQNDYELYLRADCGRGEVSDWVGPVSFTTSCDVISTFPVTTDFTLNPPTVCWSEADNTDESGATPIPTDLGSSEWSAGRSFNSIPSNRINLYNTGTNDWLISPTYDIPAGIDHELIVNVAVTGYNSSSAGTMGSDDEVYLVGSTDGGISWFPGGPSWNASNQPSELGTSYTFPLPPISGAFQFAFYATEGTIDDPEDFDFHVGEFTIREVPSCLEPTNLTATVQSISTVDLAWSAGGTESLWNIEVYEQGADTSTATPLYTETGATQTSTTVTGLDIGNYTAYVQADCGGTEGVSPFASKNFTIGYCESTPSSNDGSGITNVQLGTTDFSTSDVTYADYRDTVVDLELDNTANLQVSFATGYTYGTNVWIDFNDDLVFDATELVFQGISTNSNPTTLDASFDIALDAAQGKHYMRIGTADSGQGTPNPCYSGTYGVTIDMAVNVIIPGSCTSLTIWDGTAWSNGAPDATSYAYIAGAYATGINGDIDACSLAINAAATVDALGYVNIDGDINVKSAGSLTVAHTGNVVQVQETATTTNGGAISVLVDTPTLDILDFMIMGSPMSAETRENVWASAWNVQDHTTANFNSVDGIVGFNFLDQELDDWNLSTGVLSAGEGYLVRPQDSYNGAGGVFNYDFNTGTLNSGVVTQTLVFNATDLESPNMLSNPYASAISADALLAANPEFDALYFWEHNTAPSTAYPGANSVGNNYSMDDVSLYNALGGTAATSGGAAPNGAIATGQGFGVFATAGGTATFNNAMRLADGNITLRNNPISRDRLWLNVNSTVYNVSGNTLLGFVADATQGVDRKYDNGRVASKVSLYSHIQGSDRGYSIQAREAFEDSMTIALGFSSIIEEVTSYKISLSDFDGEAWLEATPYLVDNQTGIVTNLMEDSYSFTSDMGEFNDRFEIIFQDRSLGSQELLASSIAMYPNPASDVVTIASPTAAITTIAVRDIRGRLILGKAVASKNVTTIDVASLDSALYLVTITTDSGSITSRLIIK